MSTSESEVGDLAIESADKDRSMQEYRLSRPVFNAADRDSGATRPAHGRRDLGRYGGTRVYRILQKRSVICTYLESPMMLTARELPIHLAKGVHSMVTALSGPEKRLAIIENLTARVVKVRCKC